MAAPASRGSAAPDSRPPRSGTRLAVELVVGLALAFVGAVFAFGLVVTLSQLGGVAANCAETGCNGGAVSGVVVLGLATVIFGWAITLGLFIVRLIQRRWAWFWPLIGIVVMVAGFYLIALLVSLLVGNPVPA